jgi:phosphoribosylformylglycinamidine synthase
MGQACRALNYPIISGNVSLYNETNGEAIFPTPAIGGVGLIKDYELSVGLSFTGPDETLFIIGPTHGHLGQSLYLREIFGREDGPPPPVDLDLEKKNGDFVRAQILSSLITACHDVSDGGILIALAEMAMASGVGARAEIDRPSKFWFGEDQARYIVCVKNAGLFVQAAEKSGVFVERLGITGGTHLLVGGQSVDVAELIRLNESWLPEFMG